MSQTHYRTTHDEFVGREPVSLRGIVNTALAYRYSLVRWAMVPAVLAAIAVALSHPRYTSSTAFVPRSKRQGSSLPGLAAQLGVMLPVGLDPTDSPQFYADLTESRGLLEAVVDSPYVGPDGHGGLRKRSLTEWLDVTGTPPVRRREKTIQKLADLTSVNVSQKTGVVSVKVTTEFPWLSKQLADHFLLEINRFNLESRQAQARAERQFTEQHMRELGAELHRAEDEATLFAQQNREVPLPPRLALEQTRLLREVSMRQDVYTAMAQAYEQARVDEIRDTPVITIVQSPEVPPEADRRHLVQKTCIALFVGLSLGFAFVLLRGGYRKVHEDGGDEDLVAREVSAAAVNDIRHPLRAVGRVLGIAQAPPSVAPPATGVAA